MGLFDKFFKKKDDNENYSYAEWYEIVIRYQPSDHGMLNPENYIKGKWLPMDKDGEDSYILGSDDLRVITKEEAEELIRRQQR